MAASPQPREPWIQILDRAGWSMISDRILHGLCHDLSGRVGSLAGLIYLLDSQDGDASGVLPFLEEEVSEVESAVRLLRLLPDDAKEPEILAPAELIGDLCLLVKAQRGLENVEVVVEGFSSAPAVRIDRTLFIRGLTVLLTAAAERAVKNGEGPIGVRAREQNGGLLLEVGPVTGGPLQPDTDPGMLPTRVMGPDGLRLWREGMIEAGLNVHGAREDGGAGSVQLSFPPPSSPDAS